MTTDAYPIPDLADEREYPDELRERCELLECFCAKEDSQTLLARDRQSDALYVAKCFLKGSPLYDRREPAALRALDAPPLPRFIAEYTGREMRCVLREYVPGHALSEVAANRAFTDGEIIRVGMQLCDQLSCLHGMRPPVIHRDIKPQNVVLRPDGTAVLIDFGISRVVSDDKADTLVYGTQGFAPPEQYGFAPTDCRSDIYALGMLLRWMRTGKADPPREGDAAAWSAAPIDRVIARCTAFDPRRRYSSVDQVRRALKHAQPAVRRRSIALKAACAACLLALIAVGGFALRQRADRAAVFAEPLIEQAARLNLGLADDAPVPKRRLSEVTALYIVADVACPDADSFYPAVNQWYAAGQPRRGETMSLADLEQLPNVGQLCIVAQSLTDLSPVAGLRSLNKVELKHNLIEDISPLAGLDQLSSVGINDNPVRDISPLIDCPSLAFLDLCDVRTYDPSVIAQLGNFNYLDLSNPTDSYDYLAGKSVLALALNWTGLTDLSVLDDVSRLESLSIGHTAVTDLRPLANHPGLKSLNIAAVPVEDLSPLMDLPQLETVVVSEDMLPLVDALGEVPFEVKVE